MTQKIRTAIALALAALFVIALLAPARSVEPVAPGTFASSAR